MPAPIPSPMHPAFPILAIGGIAIITYFILCAIKDGKKPSEPTDD